MNVGSEEQKGHDLAKETHALFNASPLQASSSSATSRAATSTKGACDVIVTDGFVGNVVLKVCEGVFEFVMKMAAKELLGALDTERAKAQQALQNPGQPL